MLVEPPTDTLLRYRGSVANHPWRSLFAPECFGVESSLRGRLDSGRMRSFTDGVCIKLLTRLRPVKVAHYQHTDRLLVRMGCSHRMRDRQAWQASLIAFSALHPFS